LTLRGRRISPTVNVLAAQTRRTLAAPPETHRLSGGRRSARPARPPASGDAPHGRAHLLGERARIKEAAALPMLISPAMRLIEPARSEDFEGFVNQFEALRHDKA